MIKTERQIKERIIKDLMYKPVIRDIKNCLFCDRLRIDKEYKSLQWETNFVMTFNNHTLCFTVCPDCRKNHNIDDIYASIIKREIKRDRYE